MEKTDSFEWMRRARWHIPKFDEFQAAMEKSKKECSDLHKMSELVFTLGCVILAFPKVPLFFDKAGNISERYSQSLVLTCFMELLRQSQSTIFLCGCGLYKNAYHNIRYSLESMVQSFYMDTRHPNVDFPTKIEILREVQDLRDYQGVRLVQKLGIEDKDKIIEQYKRLSSRVHFTYEQHMVTASDVMDSNYHVTKVDCNEVSNIYDSMKMFYAIFFFLFLTYFPELKKPLTENTEFVKTVKDHNLTLLLKALSG